MFPFKLKKKENLFEALARVAGSFLPGGQTPRQAAQETFRQAPPPSIRQRAAQATPFPAAGAAFRLGRDVFNTDLAKAGRAGLRSGVYEPLVNLGADVQRYNPLVRDKSVIDRDRRGAIEVGRRVAPDPTTKIGKVAKGAVELGTIAAPGAIATKAIRTAPRVAEAIRAGSKLASAGSFVAGGAPSSVAYTLQQSAKRDKPASGGELAKELAIGAGIDLATLGAGRLARPLIKGLTKGRGVRPGKTGELISKQSVPEAPVRVSSPEPVKLAPPKFGQPIVKTPENLKAPVTVKPVTPETAPAFARVATREAEQSVIDSLPKTVRTKVVNDLPLTRQDSVKINEVRAKINRRLGVSPEQQGLGLGVATPTGRVRQFEGAATRVTPSGRVKDVAKGTVAIRKESAERIGAFASGKPTAISRTIAQFPGQSAKKFRAFATNLNSIRRKSPQVADDLNNAVFRPMTEYAAHAARVKQGVINKLLQTKKATNFRKADQKVLGQVLEGKATPEAAKNPGAVQRMASEMRESYDNLLAELNRQELAAGVDLTPRRKDYMSHIKELLGEERFLAPAKQADPDFIRRVGTAFGYGKERTGRLARVKEDPFEIMDIYASAIEARVRSLVPSRNINLIVDSLDQLKLSDPRGVKEFRGWLKSVNDNLTGGKAGASPLDRTQGRIARGVVLGNPSSIANNFIQPTILAGFRPINSIEGAYKTLFAGLKAMQKGNMDEFLKVGGIESTYLRNTFNAIDLKKLANKNVFEKMGDVAARSFYVTDMTSKKQVIESLFAKFKGSGLSVREALRQAEQQAETLLPSRAPGTLAPTLGESSVGRAASLFQTEVIAQWEAVAEATRARGIFTGPKGGIRGATRGVANLVGMSLVAHQFNNAFSVIFPGRRPAPDAIGWLQQALEDDDITNDSFMDNTLQFLKQGVGQLPIVGNYFSEFSGRSPFPGYEITKGIATSVGDVAQGNLDKESLTRAGRNVSALVGRGTRPLFRGAEGVYDFVAGSEDKGFETEQTGANFVRSLLGGSYNTKEAQEMFQNKDNRDKIIGQFDSQTQEDFKNIVGRGYEESGDYTRVKSVIDQGVQFERLFQNPKLVDLFTALTEFDKKQGKPVDPAFNAEFYQQNNLDREQSQKTAFRYLAAGSQEDEIEQKALKQLNPWLEKLDDARSEFFDKVTGTGRKDLETITYGPDMERPKLEGELKNKLNQFFQFSPESTEDYAAREQFLADNPDVGEYLDNNARYARAKRDYLGKPQLDPYPEGSEAQQQKLDQYYALPKGNGPRGGSPDRSAFLKSNPDIVALWTARSIWTLQQEGSLGAYEGIEFSQDAMKATDRLAKNIVQLPDGSYAFGDEGGFGGSGFAGGGSGGGRSGRRSFGTVSIAQPRNIPTPTISVPRRTVKVKPSPKKSAKIKLG